VPQKAERDLAPLRIFSLPKISTFSSIISSCGLEFNGTFAVFLMSLMDLDTRYLHHEKEGTGEREREKEIDSRSIRRSPKVRVMYDHRACSNECYGIRVT